MILFTATNSSTIGFNLHNRKCARKSVTRKSGHPLLDEGGELNIHGCPDFCDWKLFAGLAGAVDLRQYKVHPHVSEYHRHKAHDREDGGASAFPVQRIPRVQVGEKNQPGDE